MNSGTFVQIVERFYLIIKYMINLKNVITILTQQLGNKLIVCFFILFISNSIFGQQKPNRKDKKNIIQQLDSIFMEDQKYRIPWLYGTLNPNKLDSIKKISQQERNVLTMKSIRDTSLKSFRDSLTILFERIDSSNMILITNIINKYGYPLYYNQTYLLVLIEHSIKRHPELLPLLKKIVIKKKISSLHYSQIHDKYLFFNNKELLYYTYNPKQLKVTSVNCHKANKARKEIGIKKMLKCECDD